MGSLLLEAHRGLLADLPPEVVLPESHRMIRTGDPGAFGRCGSCCTGGGALRRCGAPGRQDCSGMVGDYRGRYRGRRSLLGSRCETAVHLAAFRPWRHNGFKAQAPLFAATRCATCRMRTAHRPFLGVWMRVEGFVCGGDERQTVPPTPSTASKLGQGFEQRRRARRKATQRVRMRGERRSG